jgi:hypothetical protein
MAFKSNFTSARLSGDTAIVSGVSSEPADDIVDIRVILAQGERIERGRVEVVGSSWQAKVPAAGFVAGPATAFGVETRHEHFTTITWAEQVDIRAP